MDEDLTSRRDQFVAEMNRIDRVVQVLLKGHLLVEEALARLIDLYVSNSEYLEEARLTFKQKLCLAKALIPTAELLPAWDVIDAINVLRNDVSHRLDISERQKKIARLRETYLRHRSPSDESGVTKEVREGSDSVLVVAVCAYSVASLAVHEAAAKRSGSKKE